MPSITQLRVELHCHTVYSHDGHIEFDGLVRAAKGKLDVVCITDHDTIEGAREFQKSSKARNAHFEVVIGEERTLAVVPPARARFRHIRRSRSRNP